MTYRIQKLSEDFYAFSVWDKGGLLFLYTGKDSKIRRHARELDWDISLKINILNRPDYELDHICG
tara:strand:+ start:135 stop:329 length:195 start_codon:yes stop_codon:yes gene_type:complete